MLTLQDKPLTQAEMDASTTPLFYYRPFTHPRTGKVVYKLYGMMHQTQDLRDFYHNYYQMTRSENGPQYLQGYAVLPNMGDRVDSQGKPLPYYL